MRLRVVCVCGLFDHMYSLQRLLNLLYRGYTSIISSSPTTSLCHSTEQGHLTPVCVSTYLIYKNKTTFFLLWLKTLGSCLQHRTLVISVFSRINSCSYLYGVTVHFCTCNYNRQRGYFCIQLCMSGRTNNVVMLVWLQMYPYFPWAWMLHVMRNIKMPQINMRVHDSTF